MYVLSIGCVIWSLPCLWSFLHTCVVGSFGTISHTKILPLHIIAKGYFGNVTAYIQSHRLEQQWRGPDCLITSLSGWPLMPDTAIFESCLVLGGPEYTCTIFRLFNQHVDTNTDVSVNFLIGIIIYNSVFRFFTGLESLQTRFFQTGFIR